jgi:hypothetical protein
VLGGRGGPGGGRKGDVRGPGDARAHGKDGGEVDGHQEGPGDQVVYGGDLDECCLFEAKRRNGLNAEQNQLQSFDVSAFDRHLSKSALKLSERNCFLFTTYFHAFPICLLHVPYVLILLLIASCVWTLDAPEQAAT